MDHEKAITRSVKQRLLRCLRRSVFPNSDKPLTFSLPISRSLRFSLPAPPTSSRPDADKPCQATCPKRIRSQSTGDMDRIDEGFHQAQQKQSFSSSTCNSKTDYLSRMPPEIIQLILSFCDTDALLALSLVSSLWHLATLDNLLWRRLYMQHPRWAHRRRRRGQQPLPSVRTTDYRSLYQRQSQLDRRWRNGDSQIKILTGHEDSIYCVQFDAEKMVTGSRDRTIKCWNLQGTCLRTLTGHSASVLCLQYDDEIMVSGSSDHTVLVWDMRTFQIVRRLWGHASGVLDVGFDDQVIASCSKDATIRIWRRHDGQLQRVLYGHRGPVNAIQLQGQRLVSASGDAVIKLWDVKTGTCLRDFRGHTRGLACIRFDGQRIVSGSNDNKIKVWNAETGECLLTCEGHTGLVRALHFDDEKIVSGSYDQSIRIWDIHTGQCLHRFPSCHTSWVFDVMFDATKIISTSQDHKIVIMDFAHGLDTTYLN